MIDIVFPDNNENEFIKLAERLGLAGLCFVYTRPKDISFFQKSTGLKLFSGVLCAGGDVKKYKDRFVTVVRAPERPEELRGLFEQHRPHVVFGLESQRRPDFLHHRASGLNHVLAVLAREKGVCVGFSFGDVLSAKQDARARIVGRMMQNIVLARKFKFGLCLASFARSPWQLRSEKDMCSFFVSLGMTGPEAKRACRGCFL